MLNNLDFLKPGAIFPPLCEIERLQNYKDNLMLFNNSTYTVEKKVFKNANTRVQRVLNDYLDIVGYPVDINYHQLTSVSISDLICGETPDFKINTKMGDKKDIDGNIVNPQQDTADTIIKDINLQNKLRQWVVDISRYGDAVARVYKDDDKPQVAVFQPSALFKIVDEGDKDNLKAIVLASVDEQSGSTAENPKYNLNVQIHEIGKYTKRVFELTIIKDIVHKVQFLEDTGRRVNLRRFKIKQQIGKDEIIDTGLSDIAVVPMHQLITSESCYGHDDYAKIDPILAEIWARIGEIAIILDKHSRPDLHAPITAFEQNSVNGEWRMKVGGGNTYVTQPGDTIPGYLTWDGQLTACFNELDILFDQLYKISEMGPIYEASGKMSGNIAYETMKASFVKPLAKARRITNDIELPIKRILSLLSQYSPTPFTVDDISVTWFDGLPNDETKEINNASAKINAGLSTPKQENINRFSLTDEQASDVDDEVQEFSARRNQSMFGFMGSGLPPPA